MNTTDTNVRMQSLVMRVQKMAGQMPGNGSPDVMGELIIRSAAKAAITYHSLTRSVSRREFITKLVTVEDELNSTLTYLEIIQKSGPFTSSQLAPLINECNELMLITEKSLKTARENQKKRLEEARKKRTAKKDV
jgi:four helix bundle protein